MDDKQQELIAITAAKWWRDLLNDCVANNEYRSTKFKIWGEKIAGDPSPKMLDDFQSKIFSLLTDSDAFRDQQEISLEVDWEPKGILLQAMQYAGIFSEWLPRKTWMVIDDKGIRVSEGYGANPERIELLTQ